MTFRRYAWCIIEKHEHCNVVYKNIRRFLSVLRFSIRSNSDVVHEVPGYFKYFLFSNAKHVLKRIKNQYYTQILFFNNNEDFLIFNEDFKHNIF